MFILYNSSINNNEKLTIKKISSFYENAEYTIEPTHTLAYFLHRLYFLFLNIYSYL